MPFSCYAAGAALLLVGMCVAQQAAGSEAGDDSVDARAKRFIQRHEKEVRPLEIDTARCWWAANVTGSEAEYQRKQAAETKLDTKLSDTAAFAQLKALHEATIADRLLRRQIDVLYLQYLAKQVDPELLKRIVAKANEVEKAFNVYRAKVGEKSYSDNEVRKILRTSHDSAQRQAVWQASKGVGRLVEQSLKELVQLRNETARRLGFKDFHVMQLRLGEQSQEEVLALFDKLDALTREPFHQAKAQIDAVLARDCGVAPDQLRPWHYHDPFFQEAPVLSGGGHEAIYAGVDIPKACREFYAGIGLPVDDVLSKSDLYEKPGKNPHAFCTDLDREGDVRVLANIVPNAQWLGTMLHELGHAVYSSKNIPRSVPYVLRTDAHTLTTEGVAMMFGRLADNAAWLEAMGIAVPDRAQFDAETTRLRRNRLLVFSRWCQVMFRFEKELYGNPNQDLNRLWWDLVENYQELKRPEGRNEPDYASKIHICSAPAYYHNYQMGELFASQVHHAIVGEVLRTSDLAGAVYVGRKEVGQFMIQKVFSPGRMMTWNELTRFATGEDLAPKAFAEDLVEGVRSAKPSGDQPVSPSRPRSRRFPRN